MLQEGLEMRKAICLLILLAFLCIGLEACKKTEEPGTGAGEGKGSTTQPKTPKPRRGETIPGD